MKKDLIIGIIENYKFESVFVFLNSLKSTGYNGEILFFYMNIDQFTLEKIRTYGVTLIEYFRPNDFSIYNYRYFLYKDFLEINSRYYSNVLIIDVRDVVFQNKPFYNFEHNNNAYVFFEEERVKIIESTDYNAVWVRNAFDNNVLKEIGDNFIINGGTLMGTPHSIVLFIRKFIEVFKFSNKHLPLDQGIFNYLGHKNLVPNLIKVSNNVSAICTMAHMKSYLFKNGIILHKNKQTFANILHQYDRHGELNNFYTQKFL